MKPYKHIIAVFLFILLLNLAVGWTSHTNGYFKNINALTDFDWIAYFPKLKANGWETIEIAETNLKQLWKKAFYDASTNQITVKGQELFQTIWNNQNLRNSLFGNRTETAARTYFNTLSSNTDSVLYNFIKIE